MWRGLEYNAELPELHHVTATRDILCLYTRAKYATYCGVSVVSTLMYVPNMKRYAPVRFARYFCDQLCDRHRLYEEGQLDAKVRYDRLVRHYSFRLRNWLTGYRKLLYQPIHTLCVISSS